MRFEAFVGISLGTNLASAAFDNYVFFFAGNNGNSSAARRCGTMPFNCVPPSVCATDSLTKKQYCCVPGSKDEVCYVNSSSCGGGSSSQPSGSQLSCGSGANAFCCLKDTEACTQRFGKDISPIMLCVIFTDQCTKVRSMFVGASSRTRQLC